MASQVPTHYAQQYANTLQLLLQQEGSVLLPGVTSKGGHVGKQASPVDQYGSIEALDVNGRYQPMPNIEPPAYRRWVLPKDKHVPQLIDNFDKLRLLIDPMSTYVQNARNAIGRSYDEEILDKIFGTNYVGEAGTTSQAFGTNQTVLVAHGAASATNLTLAKLREAKRILRSRNVNFQKEEVYCAINAANHDSLLAEIQVVSADYNGGMAPLVTDKLEMYMGIKFIHTELLPTGTDDASGTSTQVPVWCKSGVYLGTWKDMESDISQRKDLTSLPWQSYLCATFGATRLEENKVVKIWAR